MGEVVIELSLVTSEVTRILDELRAALAEAPEEVRQLALDFFDRAPELVRVECRRTPGALLVLDLEPAQGLLDLVAAVRARDLDRVIVKDAHTDSSA